MTDNQGSLTREAQCEGLKHVRDEARRRLEEHTRSMPQAVEPAPLAGVPGGSLDVEAERRAEMSRLQRAVLDAQRAYEDQCGEIAY